MSTILITGGAGFIGTNLAKRLANHRHTVYVYDNLSRPGVGDNLDWLLSHYGDQVTFVHGDVRSGRALDELVAKCDAVFHLAAQVAVTSSLVDPIHDFEVNARGTLNLLEALRRHPGKKPFLLYTSTNKVLGGLEDLLLFEEETRYLPESPVLRVSGIGEERGIEFCSPYGCSKGAADQYVLDYARCFEIPATVFRMSCIYGAHQCGNEDQGWVAHFIKQALARKPITFYGNGKQVRDALDVDDLIDAFLSAWDQSDKVAKHAFNIGGGPTNAISLIELVRMIGQISGEAPEVRLEDWRPSDQRYYVSNFQKFAELTGWSPKTRVVSGVTRLYEWLESAPRVRGAEADLCMYS